MRLTTRILGAVIGMVVAVSGAGIVASPALAAPDPSLYPNVVDVTPAVTTTISNTSGAKAVSLPVGAVPAGTAKVLHGQYVNAIGEDVCLFLTAQSIGYFSMTGTGVPDLTVIESDGLAVPAGALPVTGASSLNTSYPISTETGEWSCDFGVMLAAGETLDFTVTVGVPVGGTPITATNTRVGVRVEAAQAPPQTWDDADYISGFVVGTFAIDASAPQTSWDLTGLVSDLTPSPTEVALISGRALGAYGSLTNDLSYPIRVSYAGFDTEGTLSRFLLSNLTDWTDSIRLEPGQSTPTFFMALGVPQTMGNEIRGTSADFEYGFTVTQASDPHTVTFNANGGTGTMANQTSDVPAALTTNAFTNGTYAFTGWNTLADGTGTSYADGATYGFGSDVTLFAQWDAPAATHTVTFNANGGTGTMADQSSNAPAALNANQFTNGAYTFAGWNTLANGTGTSYADGATYGFGSDVTLFAQWTPPAAPHTVTFNANGGTGTMADQSSSVPAALNANQFTNTGYYFAGWNTLADGTGTSYADGAPYGFGSDVTLFAQWSTVAPSHTVSFHSNGGSGTMASQSANTATALRPNAFTFAGHTFAGWNTSPDGSGLAFANNAVLAFDTDLALYAQWTANGGGGGNHDDHLVNTGGSPLPGYIASAALILLGGGFCLILLRRRKRDEQA